MVQAARADDQMPAARTVSIRELEQRTGEIVRAVHESGEAVDIMEGGRVIARVMPSPALPASADDTRRQARRDWLARMDEVARDLGTDWPAGVSAQDVIDDVRGLDCESSAAC